MPGDRGDEAAPRAAAARIGRLEIPSADPARAARFYRRALGWEVHEVPWSGDTYLSLAPPSGPGAGLTDAATLGSDRPLAIFHVEGVPLAAWLQRIVAAGGSVDGEPRRIDGMGEFARFRDPEGHLFGLWRPAGDDRPAGP